MNLDEKVEAIRQALLWFSSAHRLSEPDLLQLSHALSGLPDSCCEPDAQAGAAAKLVEPEEFGV